MDATRPTDERFPVSRSVSHLDHLRKDRHGDLTRLFGSDVQTHRAVDAVNLGLRVACFEETLDAGQMRPPRTHRANVFGGALEHHRQHGVFEPGIRG